MCGNKINMSVSKIGTLHNTGHALRRCFAISRTAILIAFNHTITKCLVKGDHRSMQLRLIQNKQENKEMPTTASI